MCLWYYMIVIYCKHDDNWDCAIVIKILRLLKGCNVTKVSRGIFRQRLSTNGELVFWWFVIILADTHSCVTGRHFISSTWKVLEWSMPKWCLTLSRSRQVQPVFTPTSLLLSAIYAPALTLQVHSCCLFIFCPGVKCFSHVNFLDLEMGPRLLPTLFLSCCWGFCYQIFKVLRLFHFTTVPLIVKLCIQIGDNIFLNCTVSDFQVKSWLINNN